MQDGKTSKTRKGDRKIISVSLPLDLYNRIVELCDHYNINRSAMISSAIANYLRDMGMRVGEQ